MGPDEAESAGRGSRHAIFACWGGACGRSPCKDDNEVWPHFRRNPGVPGKQRLLGWKPAGRGGFSRLLCRSSLKYARYLSLLTPCTRENSLPSLPPYNFIAGSRKTSRMRVSRGMDFP